jgi:hypothetical protein
MVLDGITQSAAGFDHTCAVAADRTVSCWGAESAGQLGHGVESAVAGSVVPVQVLRSGNVAPAPVVFLVGVVSTADVASTPAASGLAVACTPIAPRVGVVVTCSVSGGEPGVEILWRAAYNPTFAGEGVTLDASGSGTFSFTIPAAALGENVTVELVEWLALVSLGVAGGPVPSSVPSGQGPMSGWMFLVLALLASAAGLAPRAGSSRKSRHGSSSF